MYYMQVPGCIYAHHVHVWRLRRTGDGNGSPGTELQAIVSHHVGAGSSKALTAEPTPLPLSCVKMFFSLLSFHFLEAHSIVIRPERLDCASVSNSPMFDVGGWSAILQVLLGGLCP